MLMEKTTVEVKQEQEQEGSGSLKICDLQPGLYSALILETRVSNRNELVSNWNT